MAEISTKKMRILELQAYAEDHGFDSVKFKFISPNGQEMRGKWVDAHFGLFRIDGMKDNEFLTVHQFRELFGDNQVEFEVIE